MAKAFSKVGDVLDMAVNQNIVVKSGSWFSYMDQRIGQGRENAKQYLKDNPEILNEIELKIRNNADADGEIKE